MAAKALFSPKTTALCRKCLSIDGALEPVTSDERGDYLLQQLFSCTNVQMKLLPEFPSYLCSACKSRFDFLDKLRSIWILNNAKIERLKEEVDTTHLTSAESTEGVGTVVKAEVDVEDSEEHYPLSQTVSNSQKLRSTYDYNHDDLFEAEEESVETLLKREPMDDHQHPQSSEVADVPRNKKKHQCPHCYVTYRDTSTLRDHIRVHTGEKPFMCKVCSKTFHVAHYLQHHMQTHNKDLNQCPHCPGKFAQPFQLKNHIRTHTGEKPFHCKVCSKAFHVERYLRLHMKVHNKDQHKCPHCPDKFALLYRLKDHIRTHTGEKPFMCQVCDKTFHAARHLRDHMYIHNKDQHKCPHCPRKFARPFHLKNHIRTHTGEKPFVCTVCSKAFHAARILREHMQIHDKDQLQCGMQQTDGVESVWIKAEIAAEDAGQDRQTSQTASNSQQKSSTYDYNHHDDLFEAEEESLETLLKREPMDDHQQL